MIITFANNKGGTGKTTSAVNLASALALSGKRVLLIDIDPQGSTTISFGFEKTKLLYTIYDVLAQSRKIDEVMLEAKVDNLTLVPSNLDLAGAEVELSSTPGREFVLREALALVKQRYDCILIDCPPNIGILTVNAIVACDTLMVPVQCEYYSMEGVQTLLQFVRIVKSRTSVRFEYRILPTMYDGRTGLSKKILRELTEKFGEHVLSNVIPRSIRMAEAPGKGVPGVLWSPKNRASIEYRRLGVELMGKKAVEGLEPQIGS